MQCRYPVMTFVTNEWSNVGKNIEEAIKSLARMYCYSIKWEHNKEAVLTYREMWLKIQPCACQY